MSPNSVTIAAFLPPTLSTLVAPGLWEPVVRGSGKPESLQTITALETEPKKYPSGIHNHSATLPFPFLLCQPMN
ncbi:MAG: hypothetical protein AXA67_05130 [Methylothermaceae bacteria B42]|nr:MAG: hypothetical protein AXA67_05130 [Methylothermaceae bacteria B42]